MATQPNQADRSQAAAQRRLPEWLPRSIVDYTPTILARRLDAVLKHDVLLQTIREAIRERPELRARLHRLTTDSRMKFVWRWLAKETKKVAIIPRATADKITTIAEALLQAPKVATISPAQANRFTAIKGAWLRGYLYRAIVADREAAYWDNAPREKKQHDTMIRVSELAQELFELLNSPGNIYRFTPWDRLDSVVYSARKPLALDQKLFEELARKTRGHYWQRGKSASGTRLRKVQANVPSYVFRLPARALLGHLPSQLKGLVVLANLSIADEGRMQNKPPSKTKHLRHTVYIRDLVRYTKSLGLRARPFMDKQGGFPLHQIIAISTNVAFNLSGSYEISTDTVRKIAAKDR